MKVSVLGAGPVGLATAMLMARDGHEVTVLEKDAQSAPATSAEAWESWERRGVAQFRQAHAVHARLRHLLEAELPEVRDELVASGARRCSLLTSFMAILDDRSPREDDERLDMLTGRRPVIESAFARVAENFPGVNVLRGVTIDGPVVGRATDGVPHVTGVQTSDGDIISADLTVDATGRRSRFVDWVVGLGGRAPHEEVSDNGFAYYTRNYRSDNTSLPEYGGPFTSVFDSFMVLTIPADNGAWTISVTTMAGDRALKGLRHNDAWERVVRSVPHVAHWIDAEPLHDVYPMAGAMDRYRRFVVDGSPVITGLAAVGDAWACTNPTAGRGISLGVMHACALRDAFREHPDDPTAFALALDVVTEEQLAPWYRLQVERDQQRSRDVQALIEESTPPPPSDDPIKKMQAAFAVGASFDPDLTRAFLEHMSVLALPQELLSRPGIFEKVASFADHPPMRLAGPTRAELVSLLN